VTLALSGGPAEVMAERKTAKYLQLAQTYTFVTIAVETLGPMNSVGLPFLSDVGRHITQVYTEQRESAFLFQCMSVLIRHLNAVAALFASRPLRMISSHSSLAFTSF